MSEELNYPTTPKTKAIEDPVARSVARDGAFSKPGSMGKSSPSKGWAPAKGIRFRAAAEKAPGRRPGRKRRNDPRSVKFY